MSYLNRPGSGAGYNCTVELSAAVYNYPGTLTNEAVAEAPAFEGYGIRAQLSVTDVSFATVTIGYKDPVWIVTKIPEEIEILRIEGWECTLNISVYDMHGSEYVDIDFMQESGEYVWAGLPESNLPETVLTPSYDYNALTGSVNGVQYNGSINPWALQISNGVVIGQSEYGSQEIPGGGEYRASVKYAAGGNELSNYTYLSEATNTYNGVVYNCFWSIEASGTSATITGEHLTRGLLNSPAIVHIDLSEYPAVYKYKVKERNGLNISNLNFEDCNGDSWSGGDSGWLQYDGRQSIQATGVLTAAGHRETVNPAFTFGNTWTIIDPVPQRIGGISCLNPESVTDYSVTVRDPETERDTTYRPQRVMIYAPLGPGGNLEGELTFTINSNVLIDNYTSGWQASNGVISGHTVTFDVGGGSLNKSGFIRPAYSGEYGDLTAAELIPHLPFNNIVKLSGAGFDPAQIYTLKITAKDRDYIYNAIAVTATVITWDLTRPAAFRGSDEEPVYSTVHLPEQYTSSGEGAGAKYYIDEKASRFPLYGPALYQSISISGFTAGQYTFNSLTASPAENKVYYNFTPEYKQTEEYGRQDIGGVYHPIERNRQGVIAAGGRFLEVPNNQKDTAPSGVVTWQFPRIGAIETQAGRATGDRLIYPRDDSGNITIAAAIRAVGGTNPPVNDLVSEAAYIGWIYTDSTANPPKIKPTTDYIVYNYYYINGDNNELEAVIDLSGAWQGLTGSGERIEFNGASASNDIQYMLKGVISPTLLQYIKGGAVKREKAAETPPGYVCRYCLRLLEIHGKILRNAAGKILRNSSGVILRGDYEV